MNTQALQHALSHLLHNMQQQMAELNQAISDVEERLAGAMATHPLQKAAQSHEPKGGGRRSAGWTTDARAQVAARMRDYWRKWREDKTYAGGSEARAARPHKSHDNAARGRSTAGWTPQARAQAAARMRARWHGHKQGSGPQGEKPCD